MRRRREVTLGPRRRGWRAAPGGRVGPSARSSTHELRQTRARHRCTRSTSRARGAEIACAARSPGETITTLDGVDHARADSCLADRDRAQAVAGVMGGGRLEVSFAQRCPSKADFKTASGRGQQASGLKTEASSRFATVRLRRAGRRPQRALARMEQIGDGLRRRDRRRLSNSGRERISAARTVWLVPGFPCLRRGRADSCAGRARPAAGEGWTVATDLPRRPAPRGRSSKKRPPLWIRQAGGDVSAVRAAPRRISASARQLVRRVQTAAGCSRR